MARRRESLAIIRYPFPAAVEDAIRGIRAAFPPRRVMVYNRMREWGGALVKAGGATWVVSHEGAIHREESDGERKRR